jgi:hypothetical protein
MHPPATADISEIAEALSPGSASSELSWLRKRRSDPPTQPGTEASAHDPAAVTRNVTGPALPDDTE